MAMGVMGPPPEPQGPSGAGLVRGHLGGKQGPAVWSDEGEPGWTKPVSPKLEPLGGPGEND